MITLACDYNESRDEFVSQDGRRWSADHLISLMKDTPRDPLPFTFPFELPADEPKPKLKGYCPTYFCEICELPASGCQCYDGQEQ